MLLASIIMDVKPYKTKIKDFAHLATAPSGPGTERSKGPFRRTRGRASAPRLPKRAVLPVVKSSHRTQSLFAGTAATPHSTLEAHHLTKFT